MWNEGYRDQGDADDGPGRSSVSSEVVVMDDAVAAVSSGVPTVSNLNITKSSRVHIGPKFVSVTQNVNNTEMIKGCVLGLELVAEKRARRLRCSVAVFVCWAFIVASGLAFYLIYVALPKYKTRLDLDIYEDWYLRRIDWQALKEYETEFLELPVKYVVIGHSAGKSCTDKYSCIQIMRSVQQQHFNRGWEDIGPNYFVGGEGLIFEGRGGNVLGVMIYGWNRKMISIMFIGNYENDQPNQLQFDHVNVVLDELVKKKVLDPKYILYGHCQNSTGQNSSKSFFVVGTSLECLLSADSDDDEQCQEFEYVTHLPLTQYLWNVIKNTTRAERLSCAIALVALLTCTSLIVYFTVKAKSSSTELLDKAPHEWNITRELWLGSTSFNLTNIEDQYVPMKLVVVQHTAGTECHSFTLCAAEVRNLERYFLNMEPPAYLPYNFIIGNEGRVYEARGWGIQGAHTFGYNRCSLGVGFVGDYRREKNLHARVTRQQMERFKMLLDEAVKYGYLDRNYRVAGAKDLTPTESPGSDLYEALLTMDHYDRRHLFVNKTCDEIKDMVLIPITTNNNVTVNNN